MPTSLVSTGVQFPDNSIQTTAAAALPSPGTSGNVLTSNGSAWTSAAAPANTVLLSTVTASNSATVDVETTFNSTYDRYMLVISKLQLSSSSGGPYLTARLKIDGSYQTSFYRWGIMYTANNISSFASATGGTNTGTSYLYVSPPYVPATGNWFLDAQIMIYNPADTNNYKNIYWTGVNGTNFNWDVTAFTGGGYYTNSASAMTGIRFLINTGDNINSGTFRLYGIKNS
jgi:hypothetical protein